MRVIEFVSMTSELKKILAEKNRAAFLQIFLSILLLHDLTFMTTFFSMVQHIIWLCLCMALYGSVWLCIAMYGYVWLCMAMYGYVWLYGFMDLHCGNIRGRV